MLSQQKMKNKLNIMVVGGSVHLSKLANQLHSIEGIQSITTVYTGIQAINDCNNVNPEIIFIDAALPGMSGFETARFIKEQTGSIKIIICSQHFNREFLLTVLALNFDGYLPGYSTVDVLEETIGQVLGSGSYSHYGVGNPTTKQLLAYQYRHLLSGTNTSPETEVFRSDQ